MKTMTISAFMILTLSSLTFAKTYTWKDYTKPFEETVSIGSSYGSSDVEVNLPESFIKSYKEISLIISASDLDSEDGAFVRINNSFWGSYNLYKSEGNIRLEIKTKYFEEGINTLNFGYKGDSKMGYSSISYQITKIYFDLPESQPSETPVTASSKPQPTETPPATPKIEPAPPPLNLILSQGTQIITKEKRTLISGRVTGGKGRISLSVSGSKVEVQKDGRFQTEISVKPGEHLLTLKAEDQSGMREEQTVKVIGEEESIPLNLAVEQGSEIRCPVSSTSERGIRKKAPCNRISGQVTGGKGRISLSVSGSKVEVQKDGRFQTEISVKPGEHLLTLKAEDQSGMREEQTVKVIGEEESIPLNLAVEQGSEIRCPVSSTSERGIRKKAPCNRISGQVTGGKGRISLSVSGSKIEVDKDGRFQTEIPVEPGERLLTLKAQDQSGLTQEQTLRIIGETSPIRLTLSPADIATVNEKTTVSGSVSGGQGNITVSVGKQAAALNSKGEFSIGVNLNIGKNDVAVVARDESGNAETQTLSIVRNYKDTTPPTITLHSERGIQRISSAKETVRGQATDESGVALVYVNSMEAQLDEKGNFQAEVFLKPGENTMTVEAFDIFENKASETFALTRELPIPEQPKPQTVEIEGKYCAFIIGINKYKYLAGLRTAVNDAEEVGKVLKENYGFEIVSLLDSDATRNNIVRKINELRERLSPSDKLLIYYAGHGYFDETTKKAYWLPADAEKNDDTNWIMSDTITSNLKRITAKHILIVSDSCYSGTLTRAAQVDLYSNKTRSGYIRKLLEKETRVLIASGGNEPVSDSGGGANSVFAKAFIKALKETDQPVFTAEEIFVGRIKEFVAGNADQTPEYSLIRDSGHDGGDFVFRKK